MSNAKQEYQHYMCSISVGKKKISQAAHHQGAKYAGKSLQTLSVEK